MKITADIWRSPNALAIDYLLLGPLRELSIPALAAVRSRRGNLWEETCFEFFLRPEGCDHYWEFNLSPAGHWNVYRFSSYRRDMQEEPSFTSLPFSVTLRPNALCLSVELDPGRIIQGEQASRLAVSAVMRTIKGETIYWALAHPSPRPDFHHKDGFTVWI